MTQTGCILANQIPEGRHSTDPGTLPALGLAWQGRGLFNFGATQ
jgi:hypothetical protein